MEGPGDTALIGCDQSLAALVPQCGGAECRGEVVALQLTVVKGPDDDRVSDGRAELLGQVERQGRLVAPAAVQEAVVRVNPQAITARTVSAKGGRKRS